MEKKLIKKISAYLLILTVMLIAVSVLTFSFLMKTTTSRIIEETAVFMEEMVSRLETVDYSYLAEIMRNSFYSKYETENPEKYGEIILNMPNDEYRTWLHDKNIKPLLESAVLKFEYLVSADYYMAVSDTVKSLIYPENSLEVHEDEYSRILENKPVTIRDGSIYRYYKKIDTAGFPETENPRILEFYFDFSQIKSLLLRNTLLLLSFFVLCVVLIWFLLLPDLNLYYFDRMENIRNSLKEILRGNKFLRIYLPGDDNIAEIGESINTILDTNQEIEKACISELNTFRVLIHNLPSGLIFLDSEGKFLFDNSFIRSLFPDQYETFPAIFYSILSRSDSEIVLQNLSAVLSGEKSSLTHRCRLYQGTMKHRFFEISVSEIKEEGGRRFVAICFNEIADTDKGEKQQIDFYKLDGMSRLAGNIANGINNILQIINGYAEYLMFENRDPDELKQILGNILDAGKRAGIMTRHLKIFSRQNKLSNPVKIKIDTLISGLKNILNDIFKPDIVLEIDSSSESGSVMGDEGQLEQVLINICINARESIEGEGKVVIKTGMAEYSDSDMKLYPEASSGSYIYISITDSGRGIPEEDIRKIFEPFYSTKRNMESSGMGLAVSYGIIMNHKGFIQVQSKQGEGSVFTLNIPAAPEEEGIEEVLLPTEEAGSPEGRTILFVDDEELIASLGKIILEKGGYRVYTASSGKEAVDFIMGSDVEIDLMIFDMVMPDMTGREAVEIINEKRPGIPVLFISGFAEGIENLSGDLKILKKPFKSDELISEVAKLIVE